MDTRLICCVLLALVVAVQASSSGAPPPCACKTVNPENRLGCNGDDGTEEEWCLYDSSYRPSGCCWDDCVPDTYYCYQPDYGTYPSFSGSGSDDTDCLWGLMNHSSRLWCHGSWAGISEEACNCLGCCYCETPGTLWCWQLEMPTP